MKIIDRYILKRYFGTFIMMLVMFIPIAIIINLAEKIDKILSNNAPFNAVAEYYLNFTIYIGYLLFPILLFLAVIWFTSKLAAKTEIVAILSSGGSFYRFLRPYFIGSFIIALLALYAGMFMVPKASKDFNEFKYQYLKKGKAVKDNKNIYRQLNDNDFIYLSNFNFNNETGYDFSFEHFDGNELKYKITASRIKYVEEDSSYTLFGYVKRKIGVDDDILERAPRKDTIFNFDLEDLTPVEYIAETFTYPELVKYIDREEQRGSKHVNRYKLVKYRKFSIPIAVFILTFIAVSVASVKRRGGIGVNLAFGVAVGLTYVFFDKIFGVMAEQSGFSPLLAVTIPNVLFGILAVYLLNHAKR
ncbi:MAG: YjgP/YjgQ family permease [Flavobacteriaceae bacterium]|nr:YjgP/YjgQ family permease [Flavobacteriaceae bacterium]